MWTHLYIGPTTVPTTGVYGVEVTTSYKDFLFPVDQLNLSSLG